MAGDRFVMFPYWSLAVGTFLGDLAYYDWAPSHIDRLVLEPLVGAWLDSGPGEDGLATGVRFGYGYERYQVRSGESRRIFQFEWIHLLVQQTGEQIDLFRASIHFPL